MGSQRQLDLKFNQPQGDIKQQEWFASYGKEHPFYLNKHYVVRSRAPNELLKAATYELAA